MRKICLVVVSFLSLVANAGRMDNWPRSENIEDRRYEYVVDTMSYDSQQLALFHTNYEYGAVNGCANLVQSQPDLDRAIEALRNLAVKPLPLELVPWKFARTYGPIVSTLAKLRVRIRQVSFERIESMGCALRTGALLQRLDQIDSDYDFLDLKIIGIIAQENSVADSLFVPGSN